MQHSYPNGTCELMCPTSEIIFREKQGLIHVLELCDGTRNKADKCKMVKEFSRSAAGRMSQRLEELRTINALLLTVHYLLHDVVTSKKVQWNVVYDYVMDRLRAVRQDLIIQSYDRPDTICILQPIVKFHAYAAYRLCEEPIEIFDPVLNNKHLLECLKRLLCLYDDSDLLFSKFSNYNGVQEKFNENIVAGETRIFMECLYVVLNLGNMEAMERAVTLPKIYRSGMVRHCIQMSLAYWRGNYVRVCREMRKLHGLLLACATLQLPALHKLCLRAMSVAYNNKQIRFPLETLADLLLYDNISQLIDDCQYYGLDVNSAGILFSKEQFSHQKPEPAPKRLCYVNEKLADVDLPSLLLNND